MVVDGFGLMELRHHSQIGEGVVHPEMVIMWKFVNLVKIGHQECGMTFQAIHLMATVTAPTRGPLSVNMTQYHDIFL